MSLVEVSNRDSLKKPDSKTQDDVDLLIRLEPDDVEIQNFSGDDSKLNIIGDIGNNDLSTKLNQDKSEESNNKSEESDIKKATPSKSLKSNYIWVSNITRGVKAADLKKLFNQSGRVISVKILTNGKNLYGYVSMENAAVAAKCVTDFNNTIFHGEKLTISKNRPDISQKTTDTVKKNTDKSRRTKVEKSNKNNAEEKNNTNENDNQTTNPDSKATKISDNSSVTSGSEKRHRSVSKLQSKLDNMYALNCKLQRKYDDIQRLYNNVTAKYNTLKNEMRKIKTENREERRRLNLDKENFEKMKKIEESRLDFDRLTLNKELSETKKLKDNLKSKMEDIRHQKASKRTRSPPKRRSPVGSRNAGNNYKDPLRPEKKFKRSDNYHRDRTPSPPSLSPEISKRSVNGMAVPSRGPYYSDGMKGPGADFAYRQTNVYTQNHWVGAYQKEQRRTNSNVNQGNPFPNARYNGPPPSLVVVPPRTGNSYYQHW